MSDLQTRLRNAMPGEIIEYLPDNFGEIQSYMNSLMAQQQANDRAAFLAPYMGGLLGGGFGIDLAAMANTPPAPRLPTCFYCGRRVVSLAGDRDATCAGCGAATS